mgnify:CR=1 FL=1
MGLNRLVGYENSLHPSHRILTSQLEYVAAKDLKVGDKLVSFEPYVTDKRSRRYLEGSVLEVKESRECTLKITLASGGVCISSSKSKWFVKTGSKYHWVDLEKMRKGTCIPKIIPEFEKLDNFDAGWLSGIYDGEGSLTIRNTTGGTCFQLSVSQARGAVLDQMKSILKSQCNVETTVSLGACVNKQVENLRIKGGVRGILKVLGQLRPLRLLNNFSPNHIGRINCPNSLNDKVVSVELLDESPTISIVVDCKTMVVNGYGQLTN